MKERKVTVVADELLIAFGELVGKTAGVTMEEGLVLLMKAGAQFTETMVPGTMAKAKQILDKKRSLQ